MTIQWFKKPKGVSIKNFKVTDPEPAKRTEDLFRCPGCGTIFSPGQDKQCATCLRDLTNVRLGE